MRCKNNPEQPAARHRFIGSAVALVCSAWLLTLPSISAAQSTMGQRDQFIGNPQCSDWKNLTSAAQFSWTTTFLSTLSMGLETRSTRGQQKYKNHEGVEEVVTAIDAHCTANPQAQASEAAAPFLNR